MTDTKVVIDKEYFDLELRFVSLVMEKSQKSLNEVLLSFTDFHERFELGLACADTPLWQKYLKEIPGQNISEVTYRTYLERHPYTFFNDKQFGCFSFHVMGDVVYIHFKNKDLPGVSPLSRERVSARIQDLTNMFAYIREEFPDAKTVRGRSWIYNLPSYCRLFPPEYVVNKEVETGDSDSIPAIPIWAQFLRYDGRRNRNFADTFLGNLQKFDIKNPREVFPCQVLKVETDIENFYRFYGV